MIQTHSTLEPRPDHAAITRTTQETWATGDFAVVALSIQAVADAIVQAADPNAGERVLDVACGSGNAALVAARRYCDVTGVDFVPELLERGRQRAAAEGVPIRFVVGDAQALPFEDASFDVVLSTFGVMFAPDQQRSADELARVCKPGRVIALASWTPEGGVGEMFRTVAKRAPAVPGLESPARWGTEAGIRTLFAERGRAFRFTRRLATQHFRSMSHALEVFRTYFGPTRRMLSKLDADGQAELLSDISRIFDQANRATDGSLALDFEYLEALVTLA